MTPDTQERLRTAARHLVERLNRIERRHRAGLEPDFLELQDLFDSNRVVERNLGEGCVVEPPKQCSLQPCNCDGFIHGDPKLGSFRNVPLCHQHLEQIRRALRGGDGVPK